MIIEATDGFRKICAYFKYTMNHIHIIKYYCNHYNIKLMVILVMECLILLNINSMDPLIDYKIYSMNTLANFTKYTS